MRLETTTIETATVETALGRIVVYAHDGALCAAGFADRAPGLRKTLTRRFGRFDTVPARDPAGAVSALRAYAGGKVSALDALAVDAGGTPFQKAVWRALRRIPAGETRSYAQIARSIGRPRAVRAVGAANGANPVAVVVPCHRVIGSSGALVGYGGGLERKRRLLEHENVVGHPRRGR